MDGHGLHGRGQGGRADRARRGARSARARTAGVEPRRQRPRAVGPRLARLSRALLRREGCESPGARGRSGAVGSRDATRASGGRAFEQRQQQIAARLPDAQSRVVSRQPLPARPLGPCLRTGIWSRPWRSADAAGDRPRPHDVRRGRKAGSPRDQCLRDGLRRGGLRAARLGRLSDCVRDHDAVRRLALHPHPAAARREAGHEPERARRGDRRRVHGLSTIVEAWP